MAKHHVKRPSPGFKAIADPGQFLRQTGVWALVLAKLCCIIANDVKHPEDHGGATQMGGDIFVAAAQQGDHPRQCFGLLDILGRQGFAVDKIQHQNTGFGVEHFG